MQPTPTLRHFVANAATDFVGATARKLRIPQPRVLRATLALLDLVRPFTSAEDFQDLARRIPMAAAGQAPRRSDAGGRAFTRLLGRLVAPAAGPRRTKAALRRAGLWDVEFVPFVSAFVRYARTRLTAAQTEGLLRSVPGLARLGSWPLDPWQPADAASPRPPREVGAPGR